MIFRILIIASIALGGLSIYFFANIYLSSVEQKTAQRIREENDLKNVLVFARDLERGTRLSDEDLTWQERKQDSIPSTAYLQSTSPQIKSTLSGRYVSRGVTGGELVSADLVVSAQAGFMALAIRPGMRAISFRTSAVQMAGGFVQPEDRLDVIYTVVRDLDGDGIANGISETILQNVRVLAVGDVPTTRTTEKPSLDQSGPDKKTKNTESVTLELTDEQARLLLSAGTSGVITFALRPVGNPSLLPEAGSVTVLDEFKQNKADVAPEPTKAPDVAPQKRVITVIRPSGRTELSVGEGAAQ